MKQFSSLIVKTPFTAKFEGKGRPIAGKIGDIFVVTNPAHMQDAGIKVDRSKRATINSGFMLTVEQVATLFTIKE